jgi:hypothetical protein
MKKNYTKRCICLLGGAAVIVAFSSSITAFADSATDIEAGPNHPVTYDNYSGNYPVITEILSSPQTIGPRTYGNWAFFANDGTGSIDIFSSKTIFSGLGYTPTVGDAITVSGTYTPFDQIPEISTVTAVSQQSTGNAIPAPTVVTIPGVKSQLPTLNFSTAGYFLQLNNVTITAAAGNTFTSAFPTTAQESSAGTSSENYTVTDGGGNSMELFDWITSYSTDGAMGGNAIPSGPVNIEGFVDVFGTGTAAVVEFVPMVITPEPSVLNLLGVGGAGSLLALISRFRKKA